MEQEASNEWLRKFKAVFIKEDSNSTAPTASSTVSASKSVPVPTPMMPVMSSAVGSVPDGSLVNDLAERFQKLINEKNQPGFDFFEYSAMVLGVSQSPVPDHFKMAYQGAKVMNPQLNKQALIESANFYKQTLENAYVETIRKGDEKRKGIVLQQENEQKQLGSEVSNIDKQIADLEQKIAELRAIQSDKNTQLATLTDKFVPQLTDVEAKLNATTTAKDQVLERLLLIEDGLKKFVE